MEVPNKKTMVSIFAGCVFLQMVCILALSANFLLAQTDTSRDTTMDIEISITENGDRKNFSAASNVPLENVIFHFDSNDSGIYLQFPYISSDTTATTTLTNWSLSLNDGDLMSSVDYNFYAMGSYEGTRYKSANNILIPADTIDDSNITLDSDLQIQFDSIPPASIYGENTISATTNIEPDSVEFKVMGPEDLIITGTQNSPTNYYFVWDTTNFPNGNYDVKTIAQKGTSRTYATFNVEVNNPDTASANTYDSTINDTADTIDDYINDTATDPLILTFTERFESPLFGDRQISISSTQEIHSCIFKIYGPIYAEFPMIKDDLAKHHLMLQTKDFPNGDYTIKVVAKNSVETAEVRLDIKIENQIAPEPDQPLTTEPTLDEPITMEPISDELVPRDPFYPTEPVEPDLIKPIPADYSNQPIPDSSTGPYHPELIPLQPEQPIIEITPECREKGFSAEECLRHNQLPDNCRNAGILNLEACKKYMFEKYNSAENIPQDKFPIECQEASAKTIDECEKIMKEMYLPKECKEQGIDDEEKCDLYLRQKHMPAECREAGARSRSECDKIMFEKFGHPECREAGIEDEEECQKFMFNKYAPQVECNNLEEWQCNNFIQERHLGNIIAKQTMFDELKENVAYLAGETIASEDLKEQLGENANIIPLKEEVKFKIILGEEKLTLDEEDNLIQTAPIILMIDSDMDGLPDDLEKRLGTDPNKADTDGDGYNDGEEVKNGNNPLGAGKLESEISPIDEAILQNKTLGHPKTEGEETKNITIKNITNLENKQDGATEGYALSGKSEPNSVVTLYIYSDLPLVITTETDKYGNWQYELGEPLTDGEHEIYVAINDNTGKVISKSKPLNFFVKEAQAISVKDFISPTANASSETEKESGSLIHYYLIIALLMITGILFFVAMIMKKKRATN